MKLQNTQYRVCYADTDQMGIVYYGNYAKLFEIGRGDAFRQIGMTYKELEESGTIMPVISMQVNYNSPALYDDLLTIETYIETFPNTRIHFSHKIYNESNKLIATGSVTLCFVDGKKRKPIRIPSIMKTALEKIWEE